MTTDPVADDDKALGPPNEELTFDGFLSYRRKDALPIAKWLRFKLSKFRVPHRLREKLPTMARGRNDARLSIFRDEDYSSANEDFWEKSIVPNLKRSRHLIVISTPGVFEPRSDGKESWTIREIDVFLELRRKDPRRKIMLVLGPGAPEDRFPGRLNDPLDGDMTELPRWNWADFRTFSDKRSRLALPRFELDDQFAKVVAPLYDIPGELIPTLRREGFRRLFLTLASALASAFVVLGIVAALWLLADHRLQQALIVQSGQLSLFSEQETARGDTRHGILLALEGLPRAGAPPRPYVASSEFALQKALAAHRELKRLTYSGGVDRAVFSPRDNLVVVIPGGNDAYIWRPDTDTQITLPHGYVVESAAFSSDGEKILTGCMDGFARIWSLDGNPFGQFPHGREDVVSATFNRDASHFVSVTRGGVARIWNVAAKTARQLPRNDVTSAVFLHKEDKVVTGSRDGTIRVWDISGEQLREIPAGAPVIAVVFSPDDQRMATITGPGDAGTVALWSAPFDKPSILQHDEKVNAVTFSRDGTRILSVGRGATVKVWDADGRPAVPPIRHPAVMTADISADDAWIVTGSGDGDVRVWPPSGQPLAQLLHDRGPVKTISFNHDGSFFVTTALDRTVRLWKPGAPPLATLRGHRNYINALAFNADGNLIATASQDAMARVFKTDGSFVRELPHGGPVKSIAFFGQRLLTASEDGAAYLWDTSDRPILKIPHPDAKVNWAAFDPKGQLIATASSDSMARIWLGDGALKALLKSHKGAVNSVTFSPDGRHALTASDDGTAILWDLEGHPIHVFSHRIANPPPVNGFGQVRSSSDYRVTHAIFADGGRKILTTSWDKTIRLWDLTGTEIATMRQPNACDQLAFDAADGRIMAGCRDFTVRIWNAAGEPIAIIDQEGPIAAFNPAGDRIAATVGQQAVLSRAYSLQELEDQVTALRLAPLSTDERKQFRLE